MPLKLNVGLARKLGQPNYGSRGASVNMELEVDTSLVGEPDKLQDRIRRMFTLYVALPNMWPSVTASASGPLKAFASAT